MYHKQDSTFAKVRDVLGDSFLKLDIDSYRLEESFEQGMAKIECSVHNAITQERLFVVEASGTGLVDALFNGIKNALASEYPSLRSITFGSFSVKGIMSTRNDASGSDAEALVELTVRSSEGTEFAFQGRSRSTGRASILATLEAASYFVNSERAFIEVHKALGHYRQSGRSDLVTKYQYLLAEIVEITSYTDVIAQIRKSEL